VRVLGFTWLGVWTPSFDWMTRFLSDLLHPKGPRIRPSNAILPLAGGDEVEVMGPGDPYHELYRALATGPVPQFRVDDLTGALEELQPAGVELVGEPDSAGDDRWANFRAPDGNVYEVASAPAERSAEGDLVRLGVRTPHFPAMVDLAERVLRLLPIRSSPGIAELVMANGDVLELFAEDEPDHAFLPLGPVGGFRVPSVRAARDRLRALDAELLGGTDRGTEDGRLAWQHFRAPDGNVFEVVGPP
jgi:catechol 2,3-dioxygenase-like lactoylglutathione lyase family enzyme